MGVGAHESLRSLPTASWFMAAWTRAPSASRPAGAQACSPCSACGIAPSTCLPVCRMGQSPLTLGPAVRTAVLEMVGGGGQPGALTGSQVPHQRARGRQAAQKQIRESAGRDSWSPLGSLRDQAAHPISRTLRRAGIQGHKDAGVWGHFTALLMAVSLGDQLLFAPGSPHL